MNRPLSFILRLLLIVVVPSFSACLGLPPIKIAPRSVPKTVEVPKTPQQIEFESKMKVFSSNESMALEIFNMPDNTSKDVMLYEIKDRGIYYWEENIKIVKELEKMELPPFLVKLIPKLMNYCNLRIKSYKFYYSIFERGENSWNPLLKRL
jgi:hypothetical protein